MWSSRPLLLLAALAAISGCDRRADSLLPQYYTDAPPVIEAGELQVLTTSEYADYLDAPDPVAWCAETDDQGRRRCLYAQVGEPELGKKGGATFTFRVPSDVDDVCLLADPETVFWNQSIARQNPDARFVYPDFTADDGDIDMYAGLTSYYNGSPGYELGDFSGHYTDALGREIEIEYNECTQASAVNDITNAHSGRGTYESCTIDVSGRAGVEYTVVLETFSVPLDDGDLSFAAAVVEGKCVRISSGGLGECSLLGESLTLDGETRACTMALEESFCKESFDSSDPVEQAWTAWKPLTAFCCANPDVCGDDPDPDTCNGFDREAFCADFPDLCC